MSINQHRLLKQARRLLVTMTIATACGCAHNKRVKVCTQVKEIIHTCYDRTTEYLACESLHGDVKARLTRFSVDEDVALSENQKEAFADMCSSGCDARKSGYSWNAIDEAFDCEKIASAKN